MQRLNAGEMSDEAGRYDDRALILIGQHKVIEQLVGAAVGLVSFQGGDKAAQGMSSECTDEYPARYQNDIAPVFGRQKRSPLIKARSNRWLLRIFGLTRWLNCRGRV